MGSEQYAVRLPARPNFPANVREAVGWRVSTGHQGSGAGLSFRTSDRTRRRDLRPVHLCSMKTGTHRPFAAALLTRAAVFPSLFVDEFRYMGASPRRTPVCTPLQCDPYFTALAAFAARDLFAGLSCAETPRAGDPRVIPFTTHLG